MKWKFAFTFCTQFKWAREKCSWHLVWGNTSNRSKSALSTQIDKWYCFWFVYVYVLYMCMCGNVLLAKKVSGKIYSIDFGPHLLALKWFVGNDSAIYNQTVLCLSTNSWDKYNCVACGFQYDKSILCVNRKHTMNTWNESFAHIWREKKLHKN